MTAFGTGFHMSTTNNTAVPGLTKTVNVPAGAVVIVSSAGGVQPQTLGAGVYSIVQLSLYVDGVNLLARRRLTAVNAAASEAGIAYWNFHQVVPLAAGSHTFDVTAFHANGGSAAFVSGPDLSLLQGMLTVTILKQ